VNAGIAIGLMPLIGFVAAAIATTLSAWIMAFQLWRGSRQMGPEAAFDARMRARLWRIVLAALGMGAVLYGVMTLLGAMLQADGLRYAALALLIGAGIIAYGIIGTAIGAFRLSDFRALKRKA